MQIIPLEQALSDTTKNKLRSFVSKGDGESGAERISAEFPRIHWAPKFSIRRDETFFTVGSCFTRNIEKFLLKNGMRSLTSDFVIPKHYYEKPVDIDNNTALNAYTPHSMLDLITLNGRDDARRAAIFQTGDDEFVDSMTSALRALDRSEAEAVRDVVLRAYQSIRQADVAVVTLGYTETWLDLSDKIHVNRSPGANRKLLRVKDRFGFFVSDPISTVGVVEKIVSQIKLQAKPGARIVLTVSPVPLQRTWTDRDVVSANLNSKSTLIAAANYVASQHPDVDYFPSYEMVTYANRKTAWAGDGVHVRPAIVESVVNQFLGSYLA